MSKIDISVIISLSNIIFNMSILCHMSILDILILFKNNFLYISINNGFNRSSNCEGFN